jgi:hypothetical protein
MKAMKHYLFIGFVLLHPFMLSAQLQAKTDLPLNMEQKWLIEKYKQFFLAKKNDAATQAFVKNYKELVAVDAFCSLRVKPEQKIKLEGSRINENNTLLQWDVLFESSNVRYVIERRYSDPFGQFDSVGVVKAMHSDSEIKNYQFLDQNTFSGITFYRLRQLDVAGKLYASEKAAVEGYNNKLNVFPNPASKNAVTVRFVKFDTGAKTQLLVKDGKGSTLYIKDNIYLENRKTYRIENLNLPKGTYFLQATNVSGTGGTVFVVQ